MNFNPQFFLKESPFNEAVTRWWCRIPIEINDWDIAANSEQNQLIDLIKERVKNWQRLMNEECERMLKD